MKRMVSLKCYVWEYKTFRGCWLFKDDCDVLTVDFYAAFYLEVVKNQWKFCVDLDNHMVLEYK